MLFLEIHIRLNEIPGVKLDKPSFEIIIGGKIYAHKGLSVLKGGIVVISLPIGLSEVESTGNQLVIAYTIDSPDGEHKIPL